MGTLGSLGRISSCSSLFLATHVVDPGSALFSTGFAGIDAPRAVFPTIAFTQNGEVCTVYASAEYFFLGNLDILSTNTLFCSICSCAQSPLVIFLGAVDDEEFFVVEGSGVALTLGVGLPDVGPPISLSDSLQR